VLSYVVTTAIFAVMRGTSARPCSAPGYHQSKSFVVTDDYHLTPLVLLLLPVHSWGCSIGVNKGGVCITLKVDDTHLCFINSHLAAHQNKVAARNADVAEIVDQLRVLGGARGGDAVTGYHHVAWMGDLNYRLEYGQQVGC
jgi:hypothetical protein